MKNVFRYSEIVSLFHPITIVKALDMVGLMFRLLTWVYTTNVKLFK